MTVEDDAGVGTSARDDPRGFAAALARAVEAKGLSLTAIQAQLAGRGVKVGLTTLSYWRSGLRRPEGRVSLDAVSELEDLLDLPLGSLAARLGPSRRLGAVAERVPYDELLDPVVPVEAVLGALDLGTSQDDVHEVSIQVALDVDDGGRLATHYTRTLYRALRAGVDRMPLVLSAQGEAILSEPTPVSLHGATRGRSVVDLDAGVCAYELLLDRRLDAGETVVVEHLVDLPVLVDGGDADDCYEQYLVRPCSDLLLWVRFDHRRLPRTAQSYRRGSDDLDEQARFLRVGAGATSIHVAAHGVGPGTVGLRWAW